MSIAKTALFLVFLASPAMAQDGARSAVAAHDAAQHFEAYAKDRAKKGERLDLTRPDVASQLNDVFDLNALSKLPAVQAGDLAWLAKWYPGCQRCARNDFDLRRGGRNDGQDSCGTQHGRV
jgi:hypothetical protein